MFVIIDIVSPKMQVSKEEIIDAWAAQLRHAEDTSESLSSSHQVEACKSRLDFMSSTSYLQSNKISHTLTRCVNSSLVQLDTKIKIIS